MRSLWVWIMLVLSSAAGTLWLLSETTAPEPRMTTASAQSYVSDNFQFEPEATASPTPTPPHPCAGTDPSLRLLPSLVEVSARDGTTKSVGTGFIVDSQRGYILTAYHVIANAKTVEVTFRNGAVKPVTAVVGKPGGDLALLKADTMAFPALRTDNDHPKKGDRVYALGYTEGVYTTREGSVTGFGYDNTGQAFAELSSALKPGMSGGPLVNGCGDVLGVTSLTHVALSLTADDLNRFVSYAQEGNLLTAAATATPRR